MSDVDTLPPMRGRARPILVMALAAFRADPFRATVSLVLRLGVGLAPVVLALALAALVRAVERGGATSVLGPALALAAAVALWQIVSELSWKVSQVLEERTSHMVDKEIMGVVSGLSGLEHFERSSHLDRIDRIRDEQWLLGMSISALLNNGLVLIQVGSTLAVLASVDLRLLLLPLFAIPSLRAGARSSRIWTATAEANESDWRRTWYLLQVARRPAEAKEIRVFGLEPELLARSRAVTDHIAAWHREARGAGAVGLVVGKAIFVAGYGMAMLLIAQGVAQGRVPVAELVLTAVLAGQVMEQAEHVTNNSSWLSWTLTAVRRYVWLLDYADTQRPPDDPTPAPARLEDGIRFEGVSFRYPGTDRDVLREVDLFLPAGSTLAVVGDNGAGKTTLVKLLCGFYRPTAGRITVDGIDLRAMDLGEWRRRTSAAFQDHARFELVAQQVVGLGELERLDDEDAVAAALERAGSAEVLDSLPSGLASQLGANWDEGVDLSGGEWQKLSLGRGMMRDTPLLLALDEPTAALDAETEHRLFDRYAAAAHEGAARAGTITVLVSHRFSTVRMADLIVVVAGGGIAESGAHGDLMRSGRLYAELYELQARAYR